MQHTEEYTVIHGHTTVKCTSVEDVVEVVKRLEYDREVPVPAPVEREVPVQRKLAVYDLPLKDAVEEVIADERVPMRPVEIVKLLRKRGVPKSEATYQRVYAALRYGNFAYDDGLWKLKSA
jgi:hypothetical protein